MSTLRVKKLLDHIDNYPNYVLFETGEFKNPLTIIDKREMIDLLEDLAQHKELFEAMYDIVRKGN
jgi:hypothetical protein